MEKLIKACNAAKHILFITGAGISAASGLPTYRGVGGLYAGRTLLPPELIMSKWIFDRFPSWVWNHLHKGYKAGANAKPNVAHDSIVLMEALVDRVTVVTQNVDGFHRMAGSSEVIELHGQADRMVCSKCRARFEGLDLANLPKLPRCPQCNGILRPPVVLFGEDLPYEAIRDLNRAIIDNPDVVIAVGTTGNFEYVLQPMMAAKKVGKFTAVINPECPPNLAFADMWVREKAEDALPYLASKLTPS
jgi:NAD-dependent deacetylase